MPKEPPVKPRHRKKVLSFGSGTRLLSEDYYLEMMHDAGEPLFRGSWRGWMRALGVPAIHIGQARYYNRFDVMQAIRAISRVGQGDFLVPGCRAQQYQQTIPEGARTELDHEYFRKVWRTIIYEIMADYRIQNEVVMPSTLAKEFIAASSNFMANLSKLAVNHVQSQMSKEARTNLPEQFSPFTPVEEEDMDAA